MFELPLHSRIQGHRTVLPFLLTGPAAFMSVECVLKRSGIETWQLHSTPGAYSCICCAKNVCACMNLVWKNGSLIAQPHSVFIYR